MYFKFKCLKTSNFGVNIDKIYWYFFTGLVSYFKVAKNRNRPFENMSKQFN